MVRDVVHLREELHAVATLRPWRRDRRAPERQVIRETHVHALLSGTAQCAQTDPGGTIVEEAVAIVVAPRGPVVRESGEPEIGHVRRDVAQLSAGKEHL